jgi:hypothetical protein
MSEAEALLRRYLAAQADKDLERPTDAVTAAAGAATWPDSAAKAGPAILRRPIAE